MTDVETFNYALPELTNLWPLVWTSGSVATASCATAFTLALTEKGSKHLGNISMAGFVIGTVATMASIVTFGAIASGERNTSFKEYATETLSLDEEAGENLWANDEIVEEGHRYELLPNGDGEGYTVIVTDLEETE